MQHRIFLVAARGESGDARRHWERRHGDLFTATPGLLGYVQNRPVDDEWARGTARFCSETWFANRETERQAYASSYYRDVVAPDESSFLDRGSAWSSPVLGEPEPIAAGRIRVLWFDERPPRGACWHALELARSVPAPGRGNRIHWATVDDAAEAMALTRGADTVAMTCVPAPFPVAGPQRSAR